MTYFGDGSWSPRPAGDVIIERDDEQYTIWKLPLDESDPHGHLRMYALWLDDKGPTTLIWTYGGRQIVSDMAPFELA